MDQERGQVSCNHPKTSPRLKASCLGTSEKAGRNSSFPREEHALRRPTLDWDTHNILKMHEISYQNLTYLHLSKKNPYTQMGWNRVATASCVRHGSQIFHSVPPPLLPDSWWLLALALPVWPQRCIPTPQLRFLMAMRESAHQLTSLA